MKPSIVKIPWTLFKMEWKGEGEGRVDSKMILLVFPLQLLQKQEKPLKKFWILGLRLSPQC